MLVATVALIALLQSTSPAAPPALEQDALLTPVVTALRACLEKTDNLARLDCYDRVARSRPAGPTSSAATAAPTGTVSSKWKIDRKINPMDDTKSYVAVLPATGDNAGLILRCQSGETEAYIGWMKYLGSGSTPVTVRLGSGAPDTRSWTLSSDHRASFYPGNDRQFMEDLAATDKLVAQVTPYGSSPITAVFDLAGIGDVVAGVRETCKWKE
jgi:type VI secretion system protein VasI